MNSWTCLEKKLIKLSKKGFWTCLVKKLIKLSKKDFLIFSIQFLPFYIQKFSSFYRLENQFFILKKSIIFLNLN